MIDRIRILAIAEERKEFLSLEDGYIWWWPDGSPHGCFAAYELRILADELDRRNAAWHAQVMADPSIGGATDEEREAAEWLDLIGGNKNDEDGEG